MIKKQIEENPCEKCFHYYACYLNSEYLPTSTCRAYTDKAGYHKQEWISVEDRLPEIHKDVLCSNGYYFEVDFIRSDGTWADTETYRYPITHWMPLPEAPKGGERMADNWEIENGSDNREDLK